MNKFVQLLLLSKITLGDLIEGSQYNNPEHYIQLKNELNTAEEEQSSLMNNINQKLTDTAFLELAVKKGEETSVPNADAATTATADPKAVKEETKEELAAAKKAAKKASRKTANKAARKAAKQAAKNKKNGVKEPFVAMTEEEAVVYLARYTDLKNAFKNDKAAAINHWK